MERLYRPVVTQKKNTHTQDEEAVQPNETARQPNSGQVRADAGEKRRGDLSELRALIGSGAGMCRLCVSAASGQHSVIHSMGFCCSAGLICTKH